jgi:hypothetical protein
MDAMTARQLTLLVCCALGAWALVGLAIAGAVALATMIADWWGE